MEEPEEASSHTHMEERGREWRTLRSRYGRWREAVESSPSPIVLLSSSSLIINALRSPFSLGQEEESE